jgi:hypothetical protein
MEDSSKKEPDTLNPYEETMNWLEEKVKARGGEFVRGKRENFEVVLNPPQSLVEKLRKK